MQLGERTNAIHRRLVELFDFAQAELLLAQFSEPVSIRSWMSTYGSLLSTIAQKTTLFALFPHNDWCSGL